MIEQKHFEVMGNEERNRLMVCYQDGGTETVKARMFATQAASIKFMFEDVGLTYALAIGLLAAQLETLKATAKALGKP